jgi:hypothetical protein
MENKSSHIIYGFVTGVIMVVMSLIFYLMGLSFQADKQYISYLLFVPLFAGVIMNGIAFSKANEGYVTFANVFGNCFKAVMVVALVMVAWNTLSIFVFPEMKEKGLEMVREQMGKKQEMTDEQLDTMVNLSRKYWNFFMVAGTIFMNLFWGAIASLLAGAIAKKKGARPFTADSF